MGRNTIILLPSLQKRLAALGENLRLARLRRRLTASQVAERTGISLPTLTAIEQGEPTVAFGAYANVLFCLGLDSDLDAVAKDDALGQKLQDATLPISRRAPRRSRSLGSGAKATKKLSLIQESEKPE
jgi:transcriptional regulator with XRE-family HTH domain